ncbi:MAG: hypothetical protein EBZ60_03105 [Betaproteobacteria bacterium]|nr:hypothetical protein [Betaproteobacteria bacterium]
MSTELKVEIAISAARLVVEEGLEYGPAKHRALRQLGLHGNSPLPDNDLVEEQVFDYLRLFHAETQPKELLALRHLALMWMQRLQAFRPHLSGAVWRGSATRLSDIYIQMFCDDPKSAELHLIDQGVSYAAQSVKGFKGEAVDTLSIQSFCPELSEYIGVHLMVYDHDDLRGALRPDSQGRSPRGDTEALRQLLDNT